MLCLVYVSTARISCPPTGAISRRDTSPCVLPKFDGFLHTMCRGAFKEACTFQRTHRAPPGIFYPVLTQEWHHASGRATESFFVHLAQHPYLSHLETNSGLGLIAPTIFRCCTTPVCPCMLTPPQERISREAQSIPWDLGRTQTASTATPETPSGGGRGGSSAESGRSRSREGGVGGSRGRSGGGGLAGSFGDDLFAGDAATALAAGHDKG